MDACVCLRDILEGSFGACGRKHIPPTDQTSHRSYVNVLIITSSGIVPPSPCWRALSPSPFAFTFFFVTIFYLSHSKETKRQFIVCNFRQNARVFFKTKLKQENTSISSKFVSFSKTSTEVTFWTRNFSPVVLLRFVRQFPFGVVETWEMKKTISNFFLKKWKIKFQITIFSVDLNLTVVKWNAIFVSKT